MIGLRRQQAAWIVPASPRRGRSGMTATLPSLPPPPAPGAECSAYRRANLVQLGVPPGDWDYLVALAGNPNTGKSTVFNALTGLRQHTGNWPGKTVTRAEGVFAYAASGIQLGGPARHLFAAGRSPDEEVARDFILFGEPDVTVVVLDATRLERNLNLALQVLEITDRVVVCLNLMDEARRHGIGIDPRSSSRELGVPVVPAVARPGVGIPTRSGPLALSPRRDRKTTPYRIEDPSPRRRIRDHGPGAADRCGVPRAAQQPLGGAPPPQCRRTHRDRAPDRRDRALGGTRWAAWSPQWEGPSPTAGADDVIGRAAALSLAAALRLP